MVVTWPARELHRRGIVGLHAPKVLAWTPRKDDRQRRHGAGPILRSRLRADPVEALRRVRQLSAGHRRTRAGPREIHEFQAQRGSYVNDANLAGNGDEG